MANFYEYLISSLPMLHLTMKLPFTFENFLERCKNFISEEDFKQVEVVSLEWQEPGSQHATVRKWLEFDTGLRNEIARIRASRRHIDPARYLRIDAGFYGPGLAHLVLSSQRNPSLIEAQRILDEARWLFLEELSNGHYFDLEFLLAYAIKLRLLERWEKINNADKKKITSELLEGN